ncbi:ABC transporter permease subunit [Acidothermaceae bacterium B102]|nr:ABC transporter permease subunit [Acidothermaceae bacterium B102]
MSQAVLTRDAVRAQPSLGAVFAAASRSEWTKLRTVRSTVWALLFAVVCIVGLGTLLTALEVSRWDHRSITEIKGFDPLLWAFGGLDSLAQLAIGVLGVLVMSSEYANGGIILTLGATPQRRLLLAAKVSTFAAVVAVVSLMTCPVTFFVCQWLLASKHAGLSIADPGALRAVFGAALHLVLIGVIAVGVGALVRRTAGAVALLFGILLVLPGLVSLLPSPWNNQVTEYLPSSAGVAMSAVVRFPNLLGPAGGLLVLCGYVAATLAAAAVLLVRRDA